MARNWEYLPGKDSFNFASILSPNKHYYGFKRTAVTSVSLQSNAAAGSNTLCLGSLPQGKER